ncbi:MAG: polysaccharide biosynthesis/export family protein [Bacteroidales bacterium]
MKIKKIYFFIIIVIFALSISSCQSTKNVVYVQKEGVQVVLGNSTLPTLPEIILKNGDNLKITIFTYDADVSAPFNGQSVSSSLDKQGVQSTGYLIDNRGEINFPVLGKLAVAGKSKSQVEDMIKNLIYPKYIKESPVVIVRIMNFKVTVLGDVSGNRVLPVSDDRISIFEAIAQANDLQITGRRDNVLLIRENIVGKRETYRIDLRDPKLIYSPFYYLQQNDLIYIEPNTRKSNMGAMDASQINLIISPFISLFSLALYFFR